MDRLRYHLKEVLQTIPVTEDMYYVELTAEYVNQMAHGLDHHHSVLVSRSGWISQECNQHKNLPCSHHTNIYTAAQNCY